MTDEPVKIMTHVMFEKIMTDKPWPITIVSWWHIVWNLLVAAMFHATQQTLYISVDNATCDLENDKNLWL